MTLTILLVALGSLALGVLLGLIYAGHLNNRPSRVQELENQIRELKEGHDEYRGSVSDHFSTTAELVQQMTENYREVYRHLATGAQDLCSPDVAGRLPPPEGGIPGEEMLEDHGMAGSGDTGKPGGLKPPRDYAARDRAGSDKTGTLSEGFGISKTRTEPPAMEPQRVEPQRVEPQRVEAVRVEPRRVEPQRVEPKRVEPKRVEPKRVEPVRVEPKRIEPERVENADTSEGVGKVRTVERVEKVENAEKTEKTERNETY